MKPDQSHNTLGNLFTDFLSHLEPKLLMSVLPAGVLQDLSFFNFSNAITGCFFTDRGLILRDANRRFSSFFGNKNILGRSLRGLFAEIGIKDSDYDEFKRQLERQGWAKIPEIEVLVEGSTHYYSLFSTLTNYNDLKYLKGLQGQFIDITQQVLLKKRQDNLASQIRHDMKNRIMVGGANSDAMLYDIKEMKENNLIPEALTEKIEEFSEMLGEIKESSNFLHNLVLMMLDVSKLQSNQLALKIKEFDIKEMLNKVVGALRPQQEEKAITVDILGDPVNLKADSVQLSRVLENYHSNAIKYTKDHIQWKIQVQGQDLILSIQDNGEGIEKEYLSRIFEPFFQVPGKEKKNSTGLGLDSVRELVLLHHGETWAESEGSGQGSTFFLQLPLEHG